MGYITYSRFGKRLSSGSHVITLIMRGEGIMAIRLHFLGATRNVTGSRFLLEVEDSRILIDCGLYQERDFQDRNWDPFIIDPETIDAVILTHSHLDHCGLLPKLAREGFSGPIYCTQVTAEIAKIVLYDSARLQEEDAWYKGKRLAKEGRKPKFPIRPLYNDTDVTKMMPQMECVDYGDTVHVTPRCSAVFHEAGHIIGSSFVLITVQDHERQRKILFSGDVGRWHRAVIRDPDPFEVADYVLTEATYGDRVHSTDSELMNDMAEVVNDTLERGGNLVVPSFAIERAQELVYRFNLLQKTKKIPKLITFLDSPMAVKVTNVFTDHPELMNEAIRAEFSDEGLSPFTFDGLTLVHSQTESQRINNILGTTVIIAGSGMCTGGRIKHHLTHNISRPESTICFVGYQAKGTLGRDILNGAKKVRILGTTYPVKAKVVQVNGFSGHADKHELLRFLRSLRQSPRKVFLVHSGSAVANSFGKYLFNKTGWQIEVPTYRQVVELE